jgi:catechol 2,3-dioxygenase-like lactoylglutathione lyase family enzyme
MGVGGFQAGAQLTHMLVVADLARSVGFYRDVVGASVQREYGETSAVLRLGGSWLLLVTGGGPTPERPSVTFAPTDLPNRVSHVMTFRVTDCPAAYALLLGRGAQFLTPPIDSGPELRCFFRDPDGHLLELSELH